MAEEKKRERIFLTKEQALQIVDAKSDGAVHTFLQNHHVFIGADWSREALLREMDECVSMELAGAGARSMRHGIAMIRKDGPSPIFLATDEDKIRNLEISLGERIKEEEVNG